MVDSARVLAVVSVQGRDQKGVVARFATYMAGHGINIEDMEQRVLRGLFVMDMLVDIHDMSISLDQLVTGLLNLGGEMEMQVRVSLQQSRRAKRVAVLVSRESHCLEALLDLSSHKKLGGEIVGVLANHPVLQTRCESASLPFEWQASGPGEAEKQSHFTWLARRLSALNPDLVVLARYMQILPPAITQAYKWKIINIHPSLLPHFPGANPYRQAFESGVRVTGCTAHFVTQDLDQGPIILQDVFHINVGVDQAEDVREHGLRLEAQTLARTVTYFLNEELIVVDDKVVFKPGINTFGKLADHQ